MHEPIRVCRVVGNMNGGGVEQVVMNGAACVPAHNGIVWTVE